MRFTYSLAVVALVAGCSDRGERETSSQPPEPSRAVGAAQGTTGSAPAAAPAPAPPPRSTEAKDAKAAETGAVAEAARRDGVNIDAAVLQSFKARTDNYLQIHRDAAKGAAKLKETGDPAKIGAAQDELAARIRAARPDAKYGDVFTPEIRDRIRRLLAPELKGEEGRDAKDVMKDDAPALAKIPFKVNAKYPEGQPLPTVAPNVLQALPTLPKPLEYRFISKHLILLDTDANLIVDFIPNAIK